MRDNFVNGLHVGETNSCVSKMEEGKMDHLDEIQNACNDHTILTFNDPE